MQPAASPALPTVPPTPAQRRQAALCCADRAGRATLAYGGSLLQASAHAALLPLGQLLYGVGLASAVAARAAPSAPGLGVMPRAQAFWQSLRGTMAAPIVPPIDDDDDAVITWALVAVALTNVPSAALLGVLCIAATPIVAAGAAVAGATRGPT